MPKNGTIITPKVQYACIDCGKLSTPKRPNQFHQTQDEYRCVACTQLKRTDVSHKVIWNCIDCGKESSLKWVSEFKKRGITKDTYRCNKCAIKYRSETNDKWRINVKTAAQRRSVENLEWIKNNKELPKNPLWQERHSEGCAKMRGRKMTVNSCQKMSDSAILRTNDPKWREDASLRQIKRFEDPVERLRLSNSQVRRFQDIGERKKISAAKQGIPLEEWLEFSKNGKYCDKWTDPKYKVRKRVRARFNDRCIICGKTRERNCGNRMSVHHIYRKKDACCAGEKVEWLFATLCITCHGLYGHNEYGLQYIREILAIEYGNKCMLSLEEYDKLYPPGSIEDKRWGYLNGH